MHICVHTAHHSQQPHHNGDKRFMNLHQNQKLFTYEHKHIISLWKKNAGAMLELVRYKFLTAQLGCSGANLSWSSWLLVEMHVGPRHSVCLFHLHYHSFGWDLFLYCLQNALYRTVCQKASAKFQPCTANFQTKTKLYSK